MSEKKLSISSHINDHTYPWFMMKLPRLIHLVYFWNGLLLQRNKVVKAMVKKALIEMPEGILIDAGSGEGMYLFPYARTFPRAKFIGIDKNKNHIRFCKNYVYKCELNNASFICQNLEDQFPVNDANILLCIGTLQYVEKDVAVTSNFYCALKKDGIVVIYTPINGKTILPVYRYFFNKKKHYENSQNRKRVYSEEEIMEKLKEAEFEIINKKYTYGKIGIIGHEIYSLLLMGVVNSKWFSVIFIMLLFCFLPLILALNFIDSFVEKNNGNGLLIVAKK